MTRAAQIISGICLGLLFFPALNVTFVALEIIRAAVAGGW